MNSIFYVYVYLDPRKPGPFVYGKYVFDFEPFYVGKGHNNRMDDHLKEVLNDHKISLKGNQLKYNKIRQILKTGDKPIIYDVNNFLNETEALLETKLIKNIGRIKLGNGTLTNLTDGGDGVSGYKHTEETKNKMKQPKSEETKNKISLTLKGVPIGFRGNNLTRLKISANTKLQVGEKNSVFETIWINNNLKNKRVKSNVLQPFLNDGWSCGRIKWKNKQEE